MSTLKVNDIVDTGGHSLLGRRNLIINGAMMFDQRNGGSSATGNNIYSLDRWLAVSDTSNKWTFQQNSGSVTPPSGFKNYYGCVSSSAYSPISTDYFGLQQRIEGYNVAHLNWGTANASEVTLSFWVRSSLTGTFGGSLLNGGQNRCYPFSYTISAANTWEYKTITVSGDTTGTWSTDSGNGLKVHFSLGAGSSRVGTANAWTGTSNVFAPSGAVDVVGTSGATFYITGVQLEVGSTATPFEHRSYGEELALCQRYYENANTHTGLNTYYLTVYRNDDWGARVGHFEFNTTKRANPTITASINAGTLSLTTNVNGFRAIGSGAVSNPTTISAWEADAEL